MKFVCMRCGYNALSIAPNATCPRCYRSNAFCRGNPFDPPIEKGAAPRQTGITTPKNTGPSSFFEPPPTEQVQIGLGPKAEPREVKRHLSQRFL